MKFETEKIPKNGRQFFPDGTSSKFNLLSKVQRSVKYVTVALRKGETLEYISNARRLVRLLNTTDPCTDGVSVE